MKENSVIFRKSFAFAVKIYHLNKMLINNREYSIADQILRAGTSIGANVEEGFGGHTLKEFAVRYSTAYKEARESRYWLRIIKETQLIPYEQVNPLIEDCEELLRLLGSAQKTLRAKLQTKT
mgnify:CR=1 FL=1